MKKGILKPGFLAKSAGPTDFSKAGRFGWDNQMRGVSHPITCEACGKEWQAGPNDKPLTVSVFLGLQIVEKCCGALLDQVYLEFSNEFTIQKLRQVLDDPKDYPILVASLREIIPRLRDAIRNHTIWEGLQKK